MITTGSKWFLGITGFALAAAFAYGWGSGGGAMGVATFGFRGGVGELAGYVVLVALAGAAALVATVVIAFRDADVDVVKEAVGAEAVPRAAPPQSASYWPVVAAFGVALVVLGLVVGAGLVAVGLVVLGAATIEWMVQSWADRATGDAESNRQIRNRLMYPLEIPVAGAAAIGAVVFLISRVLLTLPKAGSNVVAVAAAVLVLAVGFTVAARPRITRSLIATLLVLGGLVVLVSGVVAAANGEREFHPHEEEPAEEGVGWGPGDSL